jgi:hypothetical protein
MKSSTKLIVFNIDISDSQNIFGFKLFNNNDAKQYLKCVKLLENNNSEITTNAESYEYSSQYFSMFNATSNELKVLQKFFDIDDDLSESNAVGFFPNAIEDAYEEGLLDEDEDESDVDDFDEDYY